MEIKWSGQIGGMIVVIYMKDLSTNTETRLTTNSAEQRFPSIYGNRVVWEDYRYCNVDIFMKDLTTNLETRLTTNSAEVQPAVYGTNVFWIDNRYGNFDIYMRS
jgi:beta propeller repeat protein